MEIVLPKINPNFKYFLLIPIVFSFLIIPKISIIFILMFLDHVNLKLKLKYWKDFPLDFIFISMIAVSYYMGFAYSVPLLVHGFFARIFHGKISKSHFIKQPILFILAYLAVVLSNKDFVSIGVALYLLRYIAEYSIKFMMTGGIDLERIGIRIMNILVAAICWMTISNVLALL